MTHYTQLLSASALGSGFRQHIYLDLLTLNAVCLPEILAMWSSGCQCLLNVVVIFEPLRCLFHKAVPPLFQTLKLSTLPYLCLCDILFVYIASYRQKTILTTWDLHPVKYWLLRHCYSMTSECHQIRQRRITCWIIKHADFLTNCTINQLKLKHVPFFSHICFRTFVPTTWMSGIWTVLIKYAQVQLILFLMDKIWKCCWLKSWHQCVGDLIRCSTLLQSRSRHYASW